MHVTLRVAPGIKSLRQTLFPVVRTAIAGAQKPDFRVVHFSVQHDHVHLLVEARDKTALSRGLRGLSIRTARAVKRRLQRSGQVWGDRVHTRALPSPREVRGGLVYVLNNFRKHLATDPRRLDPCSSAAWFDGFADFRSRPPAGAAPVAAARTWLAAVGWRRHGLIRIAERPGAVARRGLSSRQPPPAKPDRCR